ncbi:hypothetical protein SLEP1_g7306 [Rubroshorea leprosula]|uniref:FAF domain-containing protein n=1 Tax=Rubroshorea leprosula TaxID=152421 RepID=A0AAV5HY90_9ROSI|nr:hypothetical protein SLEP1_g7306 [Rubroshorea leprosula]
MSATLSKSLGLSSVLKMEEETIVTKKQGIVSILGSDGEKPTTKAASLRRTLSADMSSKKWLAQNGFSPMKKIASSGEFSLAITDSSSEEEDECEERKKPCNIWASIQEETSKKENEKLAPFDTWSAIISQKAQEDTSSKSLPPPYIHPLVKRSSSSLSGKSLEICTESLGSETGSDGFSSCPTSENSDVEEEEEEEEEEEQEEEEQELQQGKQDRVLFNYEEPRVVKDNYAAVGEEEEEEQEEEEQELQQGKQDRVLFNYEEPRVVKDNYAAVGKKSLVRSFPPPISSLSRNDGASVRMTSRRTNGRLVLEAVSVPSKNNFHAQRQDGRLVLTFANTTLTEPDPEDEEANELDELFEEFDNFGEEMDTEEDDEEEGEDEIFVMEQALKLSSRATNVHRLALMMNNPTGLVNRNPTWPSKFNEIVEFGEEEKIDPTPTQAQSLPPRPPVARMIPSPKSKVGGAAASLNAYEYFWRSKPMSKASVLNPNPQHPTPLKGPKNAISQDQQLREKNGDYLVPLLKGCKESRRSLLSWEPHCIATS